MQSQPLTNKKTFAIILAIFIFLAIALTLAIVLVTKSNTPARDDPYLYTQSQTELMEYRQSLRTSDRAFSVLPYDSNPGHLNGYRVFAVEPQSPEDKVIIDITIRNCESSVYNNLRTAALSWLREQGLNLSNYTIKYNTCP